MAFLVAQMVKNLSEIEETWETQSLGWEDPLEKGIGNPLQYSYVKNSMKFWWTTVHGVAKSQTRLSDKRFLA